MRNGRWLHSTLRDPHFHEINTVTHAELGLLAIGKSCDATVLCPVRNLSLPILCNTVGGHDGHAHGCILEGHGLVLAVLGLELNNPLTSIGNLSSPGG